ncbi:acyl dehydratase [Halobacteriales archaeon QH_2_66_30]|nr:MAG: acyl dehydratase [Halobacteriales archaeon QH_2_66_30]
MRSPVETIEHDATAREAATRLSGSGIGSLVITDGDRPAGIVTDVDLTRLVADGHDPETTEVERITSSPVVTTTADATILAAAETMRDNKIKRLPVVDDDGALAGIVTTTDLSNYLPHLSRFKRKETESAESTQRRDVRTDTAYENDDWDHEYVGDEAEIEVGETSRFTKTEQTRFGERIAHGTLVAGMISAALARLPGLTIYLSQEVSYLGPVPIDGEVTAECEVVERIGDNRFRLTTTVERADGETVIDGEAVVMSDPLPDL